MDVSILGAMADDRSALDVIGADHQIATKRGPMREPHETAPPREVAEVKSQIGPPTEIVVQLEKRGAVKEIAADAREIEKEIGHPEMDVRGVSGARGTMAELLAEVRS